MGQIGLGIRPARFEPSPPAFPIRFLRVHPPRIPSTKTNEHRSERGTCLAGRIPERSSVVTTSCVSFRLTHGRCGSRGGKRRRERSGRRCRELSHPDGLQGMGRSRKHKNRAPPGMPVHVSRTETPGLLPLGNLVCPGFPKSEGGCASSGVGDRATVGSRAAPVGRQSDAASLDSLDPIATRKRKRRCPGAPRLEPGKALPCSPKSVGLFHKSEAEAKQLAATPPAHRGFVVLTRCYKRALAQCRSGYWRGL